MLAVPPLLVLGISLIYSKSKRGDYRLAYLTGQLMIVIVQLAICSPCSAISFNTDLHTASSLATFCSSFLLPLISSLVSLLSFDKFEQQSLSASANSLWKHVRSSAAFPINDLKLDCISSKALLHSCSCIYARAVSLRLVSMLFFKLSAYSRSTMRLLNLRLVSQHTFEMLITA